MQNKEDFYVVDAHCDTLMVCTGRGLNKSQRAAIDFFADNPGAHMDLPKMRRGHLACQFMALFLEDDQLNEATVNAHKMIDAFESLLNDVRAQNAFVPAKSGSDIRRATERNQVSALLSIEGAEALGESIDAFDGFYERGVRALGLTWNRRNAFGRGLKAEGSDGLSPLGKQLTEKLVAMRVLVDVAHLSEEGFWEVADIVKGPFIDSHANARAVLDHARNLTDRQIRAIADHGGAVGCVFVPYFITKNPDTCSMAAFLQHIDHIVKTGGIESCAIGSDFDGFSPAKGSVMADAGEFSVLYSALRERGYSHNDAQKILGGNWLRVTEEVLG